MTYHIINTETEEIIASYDSFKVALTACRMLAHQRAHGLGIVFGGAMVTDMSAAKWGC